MSFSPEFSEEWLQYVTPNRRRELLQVLAEISRLYQTYQSPFVLVGACSLLIRGCLKYKAWWDVDLLFESPDEITRFHKLSGTPELQIVPVDFHPIDYGYLQSMQTMWGVKNVWYRVDYIYRDEYYHFHSVSPEKDNMYRIRLNLNSQKYDLWLPVAHPWNIFIDKLLSPRLKFELGVRDGYSIDIRHIFILFSLYRHDPGFWEYISRKSTELTNGTNVKENLRNLLLAKDELGYQSVIVGEKDFQMIDSL